MPRRHSQSANRHPAADSLSATTISNIARIDGVLDSKTSDFPEQLFAGGGELGSRMAAIDWSKSPLGPVSTWPQSLKTCIRIILTSRQPMFVWWGDSLINLYNDAYKSIVGGKHPEALGQPARVVWHEIWNQISTRAASAMERNEGTYDEALLLIMERYGYQEETYYTFSYSPVPNDQGGTGGIICANTDDTAPIVSERQVTVLRELAAETADARSWSEACRVAAASFKSNPKDLCFTLIYLHDSSTNSVVLAGCSGIDIGHIAAPERVNLDGSALWPFEQVLRTHEAAVVPLDSLADLPGGWWDRAPSHAAALHIAPSGPAGLAGVLIVGLNPFRRFDDSYSGFLSLVAGQISASIANAQAYEQERKRAEMLAELDRAKTIFFSNVSHEFRTPLTLMLGPTEDALRSPDRALRVPQLETVHRNQLRLLKLVNTLLEFSRLEAGRIKASYQPTDLARFTSELASVFRSAVERAGLSLEVDCPPLPQQVYVDQDMWEKVVLNLLSNALKSTFEGVISVHLRDAGDHAELSISDTGTGIPDKEIPHIFERFRRIEGARRRTHEGSGIGLALVHELVRMHSGNIAVQSQLNQGTSFTVSVPYGASHLAQERINAGGPSSIHVAAAAYVQEALSWLPAENSGSAEVAGVDLDLDPVDTPAAESDSSSRPRVLLVDDNRDMREYVNGLLSNRFEVLSAENGRVALDLALTTQPDLVLSDVMMPEMDGFQLLSALRQQPSTETIPVILLSARAGEESRVEGMLAGADDYLVKPFTARELVARVDAHIRISRFRKEALQRELQLQQELQEVRQLAADAVQNITDGFFMLDPDWHFTYVNEAGEKMLSPSGAAENVVGSTLWQTLPQLLATDAEVRFLRGMEQRVPVQFDIFHNQCWYSLRVYPAPGEGVVMYAADVTARKLAEEALRMKQEHLLLTQQAAGIGSWELDLDEEALSISPEFAEIAGLPPHASHLRLSDFLGRLFFSSDRKELEDALSRALRARKDFSVQLRLRRPDNSVRLVSNRGKVFYNQGKPIVLGVLVDITPPEIEPALSTRPRKISKTRKSVSRN